MKTSAVKTALLIMMSIMMVVNMIPNHAFAMTSGKVKQGMQASQGQSDGDGLRLAAETGEYTITMRPLQGEITDYDSGEMKVEVFDTDGNQIWSYNFADQSDVAGGKWGQRSMTDTFRSPERIRITGRCMVDGGWTDVFYEADFQECVPTTARDDLTQVDFFEYSIQKVKPLEYVDANDSPQSQEIYGVYNGERGLNSGWYAVRESKTVYSTINITGNVNLVLCDGATLTATRGIVLPTNVIGVSLTIW